MTNTPKIFLAKIDRDSFAPCWLWTGRKLKRGYGIFRASLHGQKFCRAHRYSWAYHNDRPIPEGMVICHSCDNPGCVNPDHLRADTQAANNEEAIAKKRWHPNVGVENGRARITPEAVRHIRESRLTQMELAAMYGLAQTQISRIKRRESWVNV